MAKCMTCRKLAPLFDREGERTSAIQMGLKVVCSFECQQPAIIKLAKNARQKREKTERKTDKESLAVLDQTIKHWRPRAQNEFNSYIRYRDRAEPCISCGRAFDSFTKIYLANSPWDCGHYLSTGAAPELRFSQDNAHKQCTECNRQLSGNAVRYRSRLIQKIGQYRVDILEGPHELPRWKWWDYKAVYNWYNKLNKVLKNEIKQRYENGV